MYKTIIFSAALAFSISLSAQIAPSIKKPSLNTESIEAVSKQDVKLDKQIKTALLKDQDLQKTAINYLKSNPETSKSLTGLLMKSKGSSNGIMESVLGDEKLSAKLISYISNNPALLKKVTSIIGL